MRLFFCTLLVTIVLAAGTTVVPAQDEASSTYRRGKLIEISDLLGSGEIEKCSIGSAKRYGGTVNAVRFRVGVQIDYFTVKTAKSLVKIYLSSELYDRRISKADAAALPSLVGTGKRITVDTYRCGGSKNITALYILSGIQLETLGSLASPAADSSR